MKKIICLLLIFACMLACASCALVDKIKGGDDEATVENIRNIVSTSLPTKIVTRTEYVGEDTLSAMYTTQIDRTSGKSQFDFEYQRYAKVEDKLASNIKEVSGTVYYAADGSVTSSSGEAWSSADALGYLSESLNLVENGFKSYEFVDNGNDLHAYVSVADSERIFGTAIEAEGDILLEIDTNGKYLHNVKISYTAKDTGANVVINTSYDYASITLA